MALGNLDFRLLRIEKIESAINLKIVMLISPRVYVAPSAKMKKGLLVEPMAVIHTNCVFGVGCLIFAGAVINHASVLGDRCHVDCNATVLGNKTVPTKQRLAAVRCLAVYKFTISVHVDRGNVRYV